MASEDEEIVSTDQLPDDPLKTTLPNWRSQGVGLQIVFALQDLVGLFHELVPILGKTEKELDIYWEKYPEATDEAEEVFGSILDPVWELEMKIKLKADLVILMCAITMEELVNQFCVYNLHKDIAESIEILSVSDKFLVACACVGKQGTKGNAVFEGMQKLSKWRNAYVHGHLVDHPTKSLRHNHLIKPRSNRNVWTSYKSLFELCTAYLNVERYLRACSLNPYTKGYRMENDEIVELLAQLSRFKFLIRDADGGIYSLKYEASDENST